MQKSRFGRAYRQSLPANHALLQQLPQTLIGIVNTLQSVSSAEDGYYAPLLLFVGSLCLDDTLKAQEDFPAAAVRDWLEATLASVNGLADEEKSVNYLLNWLSQKQQGQDGDSCFLVRIAPNAQETATANQQRYTIRGWYISDISAYRQSAGGALPETKELYLLGDSLDKPLTFPKGELEIQLREIIKVYEETETDDLPQSLQIFLPPELMNLPVDSWQSDLEGLFGDTFGITYGQGFYIRCGSRLSNRKVRRGVWQERWDLIKQHQIDDSRDCFLAGDDESLVALNRKIRGETKKFGVKYTCVPKSPDPSGKMQKHFFHLLSGSTLPGALWLRQLPEGSSCEEAIDELLKSACLAEMYRSVQTRRTKEDDHLGKHLSLVWDDPYLLPPDFQAS